MSIEEIEKRSYEVWKQSLFLLLLSINSANSTEQLHSVRHYAKYCVYEVE